MPDLGTEVTCFLCSAALLALYFAYLRYQLRRDPEYTIQGMNLMLRRRWVITMMEAKPSATSVQTIHNTIMAATFLASTAVVLALGVLTLSAESGELGQTWSAYAASFQSEIFLIKLLLLLADFFAAFLAFTTALRIYGYLSYMMNIPLSQKHPNISAAHVAQHLNRGGAYYSMGMRAFYIAVPLIFWLVGPYYMLAATVGLIALLHTIDRIPKAKLGTGG